MRTVRALGQLELAPARALELWADPARWPGFVEGFARLVEQDPLWPAVGARVVWESIPEGRGRVCERVAEHEREPRPTLVTELSERPLGGGAERVRGRQTVTFATAEGAPGALARAELRLEYELLRGPGAITDLLFVRRALRDALERTLDRFANEAAQEGAR